VTKDHKLYNNILLSYILEMVFILKGNFRNGQKPLNKIADFLEISPFKNCARAASCISADFEMNWAWRMLPSDLRDARGTTERKNVPKILTLLENAKIPITWATVGHLLLNSCTKDNDGKPHANMPRPPKNNFWKGDWYKHDPCGKCTDFPLWYAPDLITLIGNSPLKHEIAAHSFSHIDFSNDTSNEKLVLHEINESIKAMEPFGIIPRSIVFPYNKMGFDYLDLLWRTGFSSYRLRDPKIRLSYPVRNASGIYSIYESMNLRTTKKYDYTLKAKLYVKKAIQRNAVYHLWFHPSDPIEIFNNEFLNILEFLSKERDRGNLWIATMSDIVAYCEARYQTSFNIQKTSVDTFLINLNCQLDQRYGNPEITFRFREDMKCRSVRLLLDNEGDGKECIIYNHPSGKYFNIPAKNCQIEIKI